MDFAGRKWSQMGKALTYALRISLTCALTLTCALHRKISLTCALTWTRGGGEGSHREQGNRERGEGRWDVSDWEQGHKHGVKHTCDTWAMYIHSAKIMSPNKDYSQKPSRRAAREQEKGGRVRGNLTLPPRRTFLDQIHTLVTRHYNTCRVSLSTSSRNL